MNEMKKTPKNEIFYKKVSFLLHEKKRYLSAMLYQDV